MKNPEIRYQHLQHAHNAQSTRYTLKSTDSNVCKNTDPYITGKYNTIYVSFERSPLILYYRK
jgi:hypothetical protein